MAVAFNHTDMAHTLEPFYSTKKDNGTGLGLWLSHGVVQKHGGSIRSPTTTWTTRLRWVNYHICNPLYGHCPHGQYLWYSHPTSGIAV